MEEKINNKRIFRYIPSIIATMILELDLKDEDVFFNKSIKRLSSISPKKSSQSHNLKKIIDHQSSIQTNEEIFPVEYPLNHSIIMSVKLIGFEDLILSMNLKDKKKQSEKLNCEYIPILFSKILLQISAILSENGGEILKCEDFEFIAVWDFSNIENIRLLPKYQRFYAKHALISAFDIMKKIDGIEIIKKHKLKISIGIEYGESSIYFFGGERRRSDYVIMGETIEGSELCLNQCNPHEIIIGRELNNIFKRKGEIITTQVGTDDKRKNLYKLNLQNTDEYELKNFQDFKNMKLKNNHIAMNHKIYKNLSKKVFIFASVLPQGLVKYLDIGEDENLKELSIITIMTVHILMNLDLIDNSLEIQHLIRDMQKATYLTRGSLLGITKTFNGLMVKCAWGLEPNTFIDEPARAIATSFVMKKLIDVYKIKLSIGIATGSCFTGLINIQGNRKVYSILGYKAIISRLLADKANRRNIRNKNNLILDKALNNDKFIVYCDKSTVKYSQKWYRYNYINDLYMFTESRQEENSLDHLNKIINDIKEKKSSKKKTLKNLKRKLKSISSKKKKSKNKNEDLSDEEFNETKSLKNSIKIEEIYIPIEYDEYFFQNTFDPFPLIRTYKHNTHNCKSNKFSYKNYLNNYLEEQNLNNININNNEITKNNFSNNNTIDEKNKKDNDDYNYLNFSIDEKSPRQISKSVYHKNNIRNRDNNISKEKIRNSQPLKYRRINSRFDSIIKKEKKPTKKEEKNIYNYINNFQNPRKNTKDYKSLLKLKKSETIFGASKNLKFLTNHMSHIFLKNKKQFYLIRGPLGCGKSLLIRKALNNFIGNNDILGGIYFKENYQFLFCNLLNPLNEILPFNTISFIFRKIYLLLKVEKRTNDIINLMDKLLLGENTIDDISFILSMGRNDIKLLDEYNAYKQSKSNNKKNKRKNNALFLSEVNKVFKKDKLFKNNIPESEIKKLEGPFFYENLEEINLFFYEMIKLYFKYLKTKQIINNISLPLIFLLDDIQLSNHHSIEFIKFLYKKTVLENDNFYKPFICIMIERTPFNKNFKKTTPLELDIFLEKHISFNLEQENTKKIICMEEGPPYEKDILNKIIIFHFNNSVLKKYGTQLTMVDGKILDFLLTKTFNGIPLLAVDLLKSLISSDKFIQTYSGEFIITSELNDESDIMDWNDIIIPYIYEKITSNSLNKILNFREILILKYASIIGTLFDMKLLNKINPLNNIIKNEDIIKLVEKLNENYFIELHNESQLKKNKLICQITFPFLRETLYQKFLMEARAPFHMKLAVIISMSKRIKYFSLDDELKFLKRNLFNSETNLIDEIKRKRREIQTLKDILETQKDLSYNNLKILLIKEICHNFYKNKLDNLLEGNIEMYSEAKSDWIPVYYLVNTNKIIFYNQDDEKKDKKKRKPILFFWLNSIFKNEISKNCESEKKRNIILEISISEDVIKWVQGISNPRRKINYYFSAERMKDIYQLEIGINFLKMKINYDAFANCFGYIKFPLYKRKWFVNKEEKYYFDRDNNINKINNKNKINGIKRQSNYISVEKLLDKSQRIKKPFELLFKSTFGCFLGLIQKNLSIVPIINYRNTKNSNKNKKDLIIQIPIHIENSINKLFSDNLHINKNEKYSLDNSLSNKESLDHYKNKEINKETVVDDNNDNYINKEEVLLNFNLNNNTENEIKKIKEEEDIKLKSKKININLHFNKEQNNNNIVNNKYADFINKTSISFPKKPSSSNLKKIDLKEGDDEPYFTESNFNTNNNINIPIELGDNSTKISGSTNIKTLTLSQIEDKKSVNNEESIQDSSKIIINLLNKTTNNNIHKENKNADLPVDINNKILYNFERSLKNEIKSRNVKKIKLKNKSQDNNYNFILKNDINNEKIIIYENKSFDDNFFKEDFNVLKETNKLNSKHINIISNQENNEEDDVHILKIFPSFKFNKTNFSKNLNYKNIFYTDPKYMYIENYHDNNKVHKSKIFDFRSKKMI